MAAHRRRTGRKRLDGPRNKSGRLIEPRDVDRGTEEIQRQRAWLAQREDGSIGDMTKTSNPLDVLLANGSIDQSQHDAGAKYGRLYAMIAGRTSSRAIVLNDDKAGRAPEDDEARAERRAKDEALLREAAADLGKLGRHVKDHVDNVAVYGRTPRWMLPVRPRAGDVRDADALVAGLEALARAFGYRRDRRAA